MSKISIITLLFLLQVFFINHQAMGEVSANSIGTIVLKLGSVYKYDENGGKVELEEYGNVFSGDRVVTGDSGFLKVKMVDDSVIRMGNNSIFLFKNYFVRSTLVKDGEFVHEKGPIRAMFKVKTDVGNIKLKSSAISANVDGAEFVADLYGNGDKASLQRMAVLSGDVKVDLLGSKPSNHESQVTVNQGNALVYDPIAGTVNVSKMSESEAARLKNDENAQLPKVEFVEDTKPAIKPAKRSGTGSFSQ